jgi:hypothetical protein
MAMPVAEITVQYVNPPKVGKKMGSIKSTSGDYYNVFPDKLDMFQAGMNYTIEYTVSDQGFKSFKKLANASAPVQIGNLAAARAVAPFKSGDTKSEEMFAMGFMNRCYQGACHVPPHDSLVIELRTLQSAWREVFSPQAPQVPQARPSAATQTVVPDDLNDEIPF